MQLGRAITLPSGSSIESAIDSMAGAISPCVAAPSRSPSAPTSSMR
jgi:hypothetical protein